MAIAKLSVFSIYIAYFLKISCHAVKETMTVFSKWNLKC